MRTSTIHLLVNRGLLRRFNSPDAAAGQACEQPYLANILLGCDGRFWVPATPRIQRDLISLGYEVVWSNEAV